VVDVLIENDNLLNPRERYTDTHGYTERLPGLCYMPGYSFMPRLKDLKEQQLYPARPRDVVLRLNNLFRGAVDIASLANSGTSLSGSRGR
jgi:TnpA family transposase